VVRGTFETVDEAGRLILRADDRSLIAVTAGDVHFGVAASLSG
jgi:BirA family biotin operon repressor/biotin-[acetyl-CoA-carboxylase] ligase